MSSWVCFDSTLKNALYPIALSAELRAHASGGTQLDDYTSRAPYGESSAVSLRPNASRPKDEVSVSSKQRVFGESRVMRSQPIRGRQSEEIRAWEARKPDPRSVEK